jgi:cell division transport system permease protein
MSLKSFWRNSWLSLTGTLVMTITLAIISFFFILSVTVNQTATMLKDKINIVVYFKDEVTNDQLTEVQKLLQSRPDVQSVVYVSKEEARTRFTEMKHLGDDLSAIFTPDENPLPRSLEIKPKQAEDTEQLFNYLKDPSFTPLFKKISYEENKVVIDRLLKITSFFKTAGLTMSVIFILISFLIIFNTIKLTIFSRRDEIEIMRLVGATDVFVKFPFVVEGMIYGVLATVAASLLVYFSYIFVVPALTSYLGDIDVGLAGFIGGNLPLIILGQLVVGVTLGAFCSWLATRRYVE